MGVQQLLIDVLLEGMARVSCTQAELARYVGITEKHLSQTLNGHSWPSPQMWDELLEAVDIHIALGAALRLVPIIANVVDGSVSSAHLHPDGFSRTVEETGEAPSAVWTT